MDADLLARLAKESAEADAEIVALTETENAAYAQLQTEAELLARTEFPEDEMTILAAAGMAVNVSGVVVEVRGYSPATLPLKYPRLLPRRGFGGHGIDISNDHPAAKARATWLAAREAKRKRIQQILAEYVALAEASTDAELAEIWPEAAAYLNRKLELAEAARERLRAKRGKA